MLESVLEHGQQDFLLDSDFLHFSALCGLFPPKRNIVKNWSHNEPLFINLVKREGKIGIDHFF